MGDVVLPERRYSINSGRGTVSSLSCPVLSWIWVRLCVRYNVQLKYGDNRQMENIYDYKSVFNKIIESRELKIINQEINIFK